MIDYIKLLEEATADEELKEKSSAVHIPNFLEQACLDLSTITPVLNPNTGKRDFDLTLDFLIKNNPEQGNLRACLNLFALLTRSKFTRMSLTSIPEYGSLTPMFLYAQKKYNGINYEDWDKTTKKFSVALGIDLEALLHLKEIPANWRESREDAFKTFKGAPLKRTSYRQSFKLKYTDGTKIPNNIQHILHQSWLANAQLRVPGAMILDVWNWDNVPEALDEVVDIENSSTSSKRSNKVKKERILV